MSKMRLAQQRTSYNKKLQPLKRQTGTVTVLFNGKYRNEKIGILREGSGENNDNL